MADAFTGEIRLLPYTFPPQDWAWCNGAKVLINQNPALLSIIGYTYGGSPNAGYFNLPNMVGTVPIGVGSGPGLTPRALGPTAVGVNGVTITSNQTANHTHTVTTKFVSGGAAVAVASLTANPAVDSWLSRGVVSAGTANAPVANFLAGPATPDTTFPAQTITAGGGVASPATHENRQPFLPINFCICTSGNYPVRP